MSGLGSLGLLDGQTVEHYHTEAGRQARLKAIRIADEDLGCFPPCSRECCARVRAYTVTSEYTGR